MAPRVRVIVPMKPLSEAKSRLRDALPDERRRLLGLAMLMHVLETVTAAGAAELAVIGGDEVVARACRRSGCRFQPEPANGLNACLAAAFEDADRDGVEAAIFLPSDLPMLAAQDIAALAMAGTAGEMTTVAPDRHNAGTNGLALRGGAKLVPAMGPESFQRHLMQLAADGSSYQILRSPGLSLDIDTPADLDLLLRLRPGWWDHAGNLVRTIESNVGAGA